MDLSLLTNNQLYLINQNPKLDKQIRKIAEDELNARKLSADQIQEIENLHNSKFLRRENEPLPIGYKILALTLPFVWIIHILATSRYPSRRQKRKWKTYWQFFCIGLFLWTIAVIQFGMLFIE
jgi:hypothetical protein